MKKKNNAQSKLVTPKDETQSHEDFLFEQGEMGWQADQLKEQEDFLNEVEKLTKSELVQLLRKARNESEQFSSWLMQKNWSNSEINKKYEQLKLIEKERIKKLTQGRQDQAIKKVAQSPHAKALGVTDFYKLLREAITIYDKQDERIKNRYPTEIRGIREIIVNLVSQPQVSIHNYTKERWEKIVRGNINSSQIGTARNQLKKSQNQAT